MGDRTKGWKEVEDEEERRWRGGAMGGEGAVKLSTLVQTALSARTEQPRSQTK